MADLDKLALALPEVTKELDEGRPAYKVAGKTFCFHRSPRPDALDPDTGARLEDVLVFYVADLEVKDMLVGDARGIYFTTPHWNGYRAVLVRKCDLKRLAAPAARSPRRRVAVPRPEEAREGVPGY